MARSMNCRVTVRIRKSPELEREIMKLSDLGKSTHMVGEMNSYKINAN